MLKIGDVQQPAEGVCTAMLIPPPEGLDEIYNNNVNHRSSKNDLYHLCRLYHQFLWALPQIPRGHPKILIIQVMNDHLA